MVCLFVCFRDQHRIKNSIKLAAVCKGQSLKPLASTKCVLGKAFNMESFGWFGLLGWGLDKMRHLIAYPCDVCSEGPMGPVQL